MSPAAVSAQALVAGLVSRSAGWGQTGHKPPPGRDALADEHAEPERERAGACVQGGVRQLLVASVKMSVRLAAGSTGLARIRTPVMAAVRFSSRGAR
jgi:hypothetical protein